MSLASKNLFALLGNDDGDETPKAPVKTVEKTTTRTAKRNEPEAPASRLPAGGGAAPRRGGASGNEAAFRDRNAGSDRNRTRGTEENAKGGARGGYGARARGGRGGRFPREQDDRHSRGIAAGSSDKQAAQGWGATEGKAELKDEQDGEAQAQAERKDAEGEAVADENAKPEEPEEKHVSYEEYLAQQAEKKLALGDNLSIRKANEGASKKWDGAQEVHREVADFIPGSSGKKQRERQQKQKQVIDIDQRYVEPERPAHGGPRGGDRGRGGPRGGPRGGGRGDRGGDRGRGGNAPRGDRGGRRENANSASINTKDESAFPSLGGK